MTTHPSILEEVERTPSQVALLQRIAHGDHAAFAAVFDLTAPIAFRYLASQVGPNAAEDLVSETFTSVWKSSSNFDPAKGDVTGWVLGIATNVLRRHRSTERRWQRNVAALADNAEPPRELAAYEAFDAPLAQAIARLRPSERQVLLLVAIGSLSVAEAAEVMGIRPGAARVRLHRARVAVRAALEPTIGGTGHAR